MIRRIALAGMLSVALFAVPSAALAGKGGSHAATVAPWLSASDGSAPAWSTYQLSGCGYTPGGQVDIVTDEPGSVSWFPVVAGADGCFSTTAPTNGAGTYTIEAYQSTGARRPGPVASTTLVVS